MTTQKAFVRYSGSSITVPPDWPGFWDAIHCFGGGQAGHNSTIGAGGNVAGTTGASGAGGHWSVVNNVAANVGDVFTFQIGAGGTGNFGAGGDTWVKNPSGTKIVQAKGGASASADIGDSSNPGGASLSATVASYDGSYGNVLTPGFGGIGGGSAGGPPLTSPTTTGVGSRGGDTNYAVGQSGGTGGGSAEAVGSPPWDAPGQAWIAGGGSPLYCGYGGGRSGPPSGFGGQNGFNCPSGHLNSATGGGGGADSSSAGCPTSADGGTGGTIAIWFDFNTGNFGGPGSGGGGGGCGFNTNTQGQFNGGNGGNGGLGGGGGGSPGTNAGPSGSQPLGSGPGTLWQTFTGTLGAPGNGGAGMVVFLYTPPSGVVSQATSNYFIERMTPIFDDNIADNQHFTVDSGIVPPSAKIATATVDGFDGIRCYGLNLLTEAGTTVLAGVIGGMDIGDSVRAFGGIVDFAFTSTFTLAFVQGFGTTSFPQVLLDQYQVAIDSGTIDGAGLRLYYVIPFMVGFPYTSQGQLLRPNHGEDAGARAGPAMGKIRRNHAFSALLYRTQGDLKFGTDFGTTLKDAPLGEYYAQPVQVQPPTLFSGTITRVLEDDYSMDGMISFQQTRPGPCTILSIAGFIQTQDK